MGGRLLDQYWIDAALYLASVLVFLAFFMKAILPLRTIAMASNVAFVIYAAGAGNIPILVLHGLLLPLNIIRVRQYLGLVRQIRLAVEGDPHIEKLIPLMKREEIAKDTVIFRKGDEAQAMYFLASGRISLPELDVEIGPGTIFGEIALFLGDRARTASAVCVEPGEICSLSEDRVKELVMEDPGFGLYLTRLIAARMNENTELNGSGGVNQGGDQR